MAKTVVGMFDNVQDARNAVRDLIDNGFSSHDVSLVARGQEDEIRRYEAGESFGEGEDLSEGIGIGALIGGLLGLGAMFIPGVGPVLAAGPLVSALAGAGVGAVAGGLIGALVDAGIPDDDAEVYAEGLRRGGTLVMVNTTDDMAPRAVNIMNAYNPVDIERRAMDWRSQEWTGFDPNAEPYTGQDIPAQHPTGMTDRETDFETTRSMGEFDRVTDLEAHRPMSELARETDLGTQPPKDEFDRETDFETPGDKFDRETDFETQQPLSGFDRETDFGTQRSMSEMEQGTDMPERHPADRPMGSPVSDAEEAFREGTTEMHGKAEEALTGMQSHLTGEGEFGKDVSEHTETIRDRLQRTEINIQEIEPEIERGYERHYGMTYGESGRDYEYYQPAYRYGYALASSGHYRDYRWEDVEPELRRDWERRNPGRLWDEIKEAVREGWN